MPEPILLKNGSVLVDGSFKAADILILDGKIARFMPYGRPIPSAVVRPIGAGVDFNHATTGGLLRVTTFAKVRLLRRKTKGNGTRKANLTKVYKLCKDSN